MTGAMITNDFVLNGGKISLGTSGSTVSGSILLTADLTIQNTAGNSNRVFKVNSAISEDATPRQLTLTGHPAPRGKHPR